MKSIFASVFDRPALPARRLAVILVSASMVALATPTSFRPANAQTACTPAFTTPGSLDTCFGVNGLVTTTVSPNNWAVGIALQSDGKSVVACSGRNPSGTGYDFYAVRHNTDGTIDQTFGTGGIARVSFTAADDVEHPYAIAIQPDDKILLAGGAHVKRSTDGFAVARLNTDGSLDDGTASDSTPGDSFGSGGKVLFGFAGDADAQDIVIQSDGRIVLAGGQSSDFALARLNTNGTLDSTFGSGGKVTAAVGKGGATAHAQAVTIQVINNQERIVAAGSRGTTSGGSVLSDFALMRFLPNGALDASFGSGGKVFTDFSHNDRVNALAISGTKIIAGGMVWWDGSYVMQDFALARYNIDGSLDTTFGTGGKVSTDILGWANYITGRMAVQPDGKIVAGGYAYPDVSSGDFAVARYNVDGSLDTSFGTNGIVVTDFYGQDDDVTGGLALQADGKIVVAGKSAGFSYVALARYMP
jgi:uncharacterized delta-60 repeat protein